MSTKINVKDVYLPLLPVNSTDAVNKAYVDSLGDLYGFNFFGVTESYPITATDLNVTTIYNTNGYNPTAVGATLSSVPTNIWRHFNTIQSTYNTFATLCAVSGSYSFIELQPGTYQFEAGSTLMNAGAHCTALLAYTQSPGEVTESFTTPGSFTWQAPVGISAVNVLIVGGGGSGGSSTEYYTGAGGGGGGVTCLNDLSVISGQIYSGFVGIGGSFGQNGQPSYFLTASAGGGLVGANATMTSAGSGGYSGSSNLTNTFYNNGNIGGAPFSPGTIIGVSAIGGAGAGVSKYAPPGSPPGVYPTPSLTAGGSFFVSYLNSGVGGGGGSASEPVSNGISGEVSYGYGGNGGAYQSSGQPGGNGIVLITYNQNLYPDIKSIPFNTLSTDASAELIIESAAFDGGSNLASYNKSLTLGRYNIAYGNQFRVAGYNNFGGVLNWDPGWYRVYYKGGAFTYHGGSGDQAGNYCCNLTYSDGESDILIGNYTPGYYTDTNFNKAQIQGLSAGYLGKNPQIGVPWFIDIYHTGGSIGIYLSDAPYDDNVSAPFGTPIWALQRLNLPLPLNVTTISTGSLAYSNSAVGGSSTSYITARATFDRVTNIALMHAYDGGRAAILGARPYGSYSGSIPSWLKTYQPTTTTAWLNIWQISPSSLYTQIPNALGDDRTGENINVY